ncbi:MAG: carboxypeptidase regulatory-like domain-containing protein [Gemmataceae bacterium]|nr:carboxypeptidase regulatory-like domain-containing protein [Gemmataceae bacterium]
MRLALLAFVILSGVATPVFAHKLIVDPRIKGDRLHVEAFYEDDTPAQQARITVLNGDTVIAEGRTDEKGVWSIAKPMPGTYLVKAESLGHAAKETLVIAESKSRAENSVGGSPLTVVDNSDSLADEERAAKTRTPWNRIGLGLGLIIGVTLMSLIFRKSRPTKSTQSE